jgi:hypothetical protein
MLDRHLFKPNSRCFSGKHGGSIRWELRLVPGS